MNIDPTAKISLKANLDFTNPAGVYIGAGSYLAFGSTILTHDMSRDLNKPVKIGKNCFIGANAILLPGVELGDQVIVGAGSVVTKSFPSNVIVTGNPAKIVKQEIRTSRLGILESA
ncbi:acyltransferase [Microbulbifer aggregans]|nr:DapH/DapD/GlmU-related protein [Microbulbifer aggregans]